MYECYSTVLSILWVLAKVGKIDNKENNKKTMISRKRTNWNSYTDQRQPQNVELVTLLLETELKSA